MTPPAWPTSSASSELPACGICREPVAADVAENCLQLVETVHDDCHSEQCHNSECWDDPDLAYDQLKMSLRGS